MSYNIVWSEFNGHGFVCQLTVDEVITAAYVDIPNEIADIGLSFSLAASYTGGFSMEDQVGSTVYVPESLATAIGIPEGYWTLVSANDSTNLMVIRGQTSSLPGVGVFAANNIRIEDFYKFSNAIPEFVTGEAARERWFTIISEGGFSPTLGQDLNVQGGITSFDGITIELNYIDRVELKRLLRSIVQTAVDTNDDTMVLDNTSTFAVSTIRKFGTTAPSPIYVNNQADFGFEPVFVNREAILITTNGGASGESRNLNCVRGILNTRPTWLEEGTVLFAGLQTGIGSDVVIKKLSSEDSYFGGPGNDDNVFYFGVVENIRLNNGTNTIEFSISPSIFKTQKRGISDNFKKNVRVEAEFPVVPTLGLPYFVCKYNNPIQNEDSLYKWVKVKDIALRLRYPYPLLTGAPSSNVIRKVKSTDSSGVSYEFTVYIDHIVFINEAAQNDFNDNGIFLKEVADRQEFLEGSRVFGPSEGNSYYRNPGFFVDIDGETVSVGEEAYDRFAELRRAIVTNFDYKRYAESESSNAELCHVFEAFVDTETVAAKNENKKNISNSFFNLISASELILQILCSDLGDGANGVFDVLPFGLGMGIDQRRINFEAFGYNQTTGQFDFTGINSATRRKLSYVFFNIFITQKDDDKVKKWIDENVLKPLNLIIFQEDNGRISISDSSDVTLSSNISNLDNNDLSLDSNSISLNVSQEYKSKNLFDRVILNEKRIWSDPISEIYDVTEVIIPGLVTDQEDSDGNPIQGTFPELFSFITTIPINIENKFAGDLNAGFGFQSRFAQIYSRIQTEIEFVAASNLFSLGDKFAIDVDNFINQDGDRNVAQIAKVVDKQTNILAEQSRYKAILINDLESQTTLWAASAETVIQIVTNPIEIVEGRYLNNNGVNDGIFVEEDVQSFVVGDQVLLYSENFELLSVDGSGNPDPRIVNSIDTVNNEITLNSAFTDGSGVDIPLNVPRIIMHDTKNNNTAFTTAYLAFFNDGESRYLN